ncbi:energy-coupling factor ABC transporter permease [Rubellimicrobium aerolatum]|uniref:Energy-coupling factor ABC transporter permease n=1 Tax=Rubellimicrobium aerolatum TaxID=490979 RepID=A0ABW0SCR9_9RHOB|nr:energy-coupling factor ABC transporter permease [Rubellimicrobium aerolatum]MBP1806149.1 ABC-type Co2+ transport system permease subunit [Rubellimicrobium aerolatum]
MHIEPGLVAGAKLALGAITAAGALGVTAKLAWEGVRDRGLPSLAARAAAATALTFGFFQVLPHYPAGVSEVHLILGSTLFLVFGAAPAALGLALGLLLQGLSFAPADLPQYGMNVTTLLVPLFAVAALARRVIAPRTPYTDLSYGQVLALSTAYQGGVVAWVAVWAVWGQGFAAVPSIATFGAAYLLVIAIEPLVDLLVLGAAKGRRNLSRAGLVTPRLHHPA